MDGCSPKYGKKRLTHHLKFMKITYRDFPARSKNKRSEETTLACSSTQKNLAFCVTQLGAWNDLPKSQFIAFTLW